MIIRKWISWYYTKKYSWFKDEDYWCFPEGWFKAFGKYLLKDIDIKLKQYGCVINIYDIKEKYGELRFYFDCDYPESIWNVDYDDEAMNNLHRCTDAINDIVDAYTHISRYVCYYCGRLDVPPSNFNGYILPICKKCCKKANLDFSPIGENYVKHWIMPDYYKYDTYVGVGEFDKTVQITVNIKPYIDRIRKRRKG